MSRKYFFLLPLTVLLLCAAAHPTAIKDLHRVAGDVWAVELVDKQKTHSVIVIWVFHGGELTQYIYRGTKQDCPNKHWSVRYEKVNDGYLNLSVQGQASYPRSYPS